tara:strand:- start:774 stop:932 length:159 start_codon:yes stop_codon:yes gene_type:complete
MELIDEAFYVKKGFGDTWKSFDANDTPLVTSLTENSCISITRFYLKFKQENG